MYLYDGQAEWCQKLLLSSLITKKSFLQSLFAYKILISHPQNSNHIE